VLPELTLSDIRQETSKEKMAALYPVFTTGIKPIPHMQSVVENTTVKYIERLFLFILFLWYYSRYLSLDLLCTEVC
jgi:hypothetical protein